MSGRAALLAGLVAVFLLPLSSGCTRDRRQTSEQRRVEIAALERERASLRDRLEGLGGKDPRLAGMPRTPIRLGVPTGLARDLIERLAAGFVDQIVLELRNIEVRKSGSIRKIVTLGEYNLRITVNRVVGRLKTGKPLVVFGGNKVAVTLPITVASGSGQATVRFKWDARHVGSAVCRDQEITQEVRGSVRPDRYTVSGSLVLKTGAHQILAEPVFLPIKVRLKVEPSAESWAAVQKILDDKSGVCGFVIDRVDIVGQVRRLIGPGFTVRLPTEKIKSVAVPVGFAPSVEVRGTTMSLAVKVSDLVITEETIWLGAEVGASAARPPAAARGRARSPSAP